MATAVVSGRVNEDVKRRVDEVLRREGKTTNDVIRDVWVTISETGKLPNIASQEELFHKKRQRFKDFIEFVGSLPPAPSWFSGMTDEDMRTMMVDDMLEQERGFVGGDLHVPAAD